MNEKPLERLNYFNGQRLQAADFKLEQHYHMRVRRWLNRSLYSAGIASGLQVYAIDGAPQVRVLPGLAIDSLGREIILLEEQIVDVVGQHNKQGVCIGPYLTIRYQEDIIEQSTDYCVPCSSSSNKPAEKGPARILADPVLELNADLPNDASGKIALACISLAAGCGSIDFVDSSVRRYIGARSATQVKQYALEGTRDVDPNNTAVIRFHIRGRQPASVTLYLRSEEFPSYFYTELGRHSHTSNVDAGKGAKTGPANGVDDHNHPAGGLGVDAHTNHSHSVFGWFSRKGISKLSDILDPTAWVDWPAGPTMFHGSAPGAPAYELPLITTFGSDLVPNGVPQEENASANGGLRLSGETLNHTVTGSTGSPVTTLQSSKFHTHTISASLDPFGADIDAQTGHALHFVTGLHIALDHKDITDRVLAQIQSNRPSSEDWSKLGQGTGPNTGNDPMASFGTGPIRLDYLAPIDENEHIIELSVDAIAGQRNGGRIHFNLYVE